MARLPTPTMAHPNFLPGESGAATSFVTASFKNAPATLAATKLWLTLTMNPRRESSFPEESFMIFSFIGDCVASEFLPTASSNNPYIPAAISGRQEWNKSRATCIAFRQTSFLSIHHEYGFHPRGRVLPLPIGAERNIRPRGHPQPDHRALR